MTDFKPKKVVSVDDPHKESARKDVYNGLDAFGKAKVEQEVNKRDYYVEKVGESEQEIDRALKEANTDKNAGIESIQLDLEDLWQTK